MCYSEVSYFTSGVIFQKKVADHFEEHKKLGRQPNFQKICGYKPKNTAEGGGVIQGCKSSGRAGLYGSARLS